MLKTDTNTNFTPQFLCSLQVNITRLPICSTLIVESFIFPHISDKPWSRNVTYFQYEDIDISSISVTSEGLPVDYGFNEEENIITIFSQERNNSVEFQLSYTALNGASAYLGGCNFTNDDDINDSGVIDRKTFNMFGWSLGNWDMQIDWLSVTFRSSELNGTLMFAFQEQGSQK